MNTIVSDTPMTPAVTQKPWLKTHLSALMLVLACLFWGLGFSWAKNLGETLNRLNGVEVDSPLGPLLGLTIRFGLATLVWVAVFPDTRTGWRWQTFDRGLAIGFTLGLGLILQHIGLGLSDEPVIAFLTNLTVVFVPLWVLLTKKKWPSKPMLMALPVALLGLALLSGLVGTAGGSTAGVIWGVGCAAAFAAEILILDGMGRKRSLGRIGLMLFGTTFIMCGLMAYNMPGFEGVNWSTLARPAVLVDLVPLTLFTTLLAFGLMVKYQPKVDATRATVIYLLEPLFATLFAWLHSGRTLSAIGFAGAGLILLANFVAEWRPRRLQSAD